MFKKLLYVGAAAVLLMGLFFGRDAVSYVSTAWTSLKDSVKDSIPIDVEIKRAKDMIANLDGPIEKNMKAIATEQVEVEKLAEQVKEKKDQLTKRREDILRLNDDLRSGDAEFVYNNREYTVSQVKTDLAARFERFKNQESTTHKLEQILDAREQGLDAARTKLKEMMSWKQDLEVSLAHLEARQKLIEANQASSDFTDTLDDSKLTRAKEVVSKIEKRIEVSERLADTRGEFSFEIQLDEPAEPKDLSGQITDYFGAGRDQIEALVSQE